MSRFITEPSQKTPFLGSEETSANFLNSSATPLSHAYLAPYIPTLVALVGRIRQELELDPSRLLTLNASRRALVRSHLDQLAGLSPHSDPSDGLKNWVEGPLVPSQVQALRMFFEEVAWVALGQALLLKSWSDRGIRKWKSNDLAGLNWALNQAVKPHVPVDRDGWQITKPNLYSWYNPGLTIQAEIWTALESCEIAQEGPSLLINLLKLTRPTDAHTTPVGYDPKFFAALWSNLSHFGMDPGPDTSPLKRKKFIFTPTLRDGTQVRSAPAHFSWIGLEHQLFQLMVCELTQLWSGPQAPPAWAQGTGLEAHGRDQLSFGALVGSPKPTLLSRISEMEACDIAFVLEERCIRASSRSQEANRFRDLADKLPYFKKIRSAGTSLGDLQACVAISKLRPGGLLWWAREEPLTSQEGTETLSYLLDHGILKYEWDLSGVEHSLPIGVQLFPKHLYLFQREFDLSARMGHRPTRVTLKGSIRSHVEVPMFLSDALKLSTHSRSNLKIHVHQSPSSQKDWTERWPDPAASETIQQIEQLRADSSPLASLTTIRATPATSSESGGGWSVPPAYRGFWMHLEETPEGSSRIKIRDLPRPGAEAKQSGYLILLLNEAWIGPIRRYLESEMVHRWVDHHAERRGNRWNLNEQLIKFIPVPQALTEALNAGELPPAGVAPFWESVAQELAYQPKKALESLSRISHDESGKKTASYLFVKAAKVHEQVRGSQARLLSLVKPDGRIDWRSLLMILPKEECIPAAIHHDVRLSGTLPPISQFPAKRRLNPPSLEFYSQLSLDLI